MMPLAHMENEEDFPNARPRIWRAINAMQIEHAVNREKLKTVEESFLRHLDFHDGMAKSLEAIKSKLESNGEVLVAVKIKLDENKKEIDSLWAFPLKAAGFIIALGGASTLAYKLARWLISNVYIRML